MLLHINFTIALKSGIHIKKNCHLVDSYFGIVFLHAMDVTYAFNARCSLKGHTNSNKPSVFSNLSGTQNIHVKSWPVAYFFFLSELTSLHIANSNRQPLLSERKSLTTKLRTLKYSGCIKYSGFPEHIYRCIKSGFIIDQLFN